MKNKPTAATSTRYDYRPLDKILTESLDPKALGNQLDETMNDLIACFARMDPDTLKWRYHVLRTLRDFFWKASAGDRVK